MQLNARMRTLTIAWALTAMACGVDRSPQRVQGADTTIDPASRATGFDPATWQPPAESAIPTDSLGASIRRGLALVMHTADSLPDFAPGHLNCTNCHINAGRNADAAPLAGSHARFPKYMDRTGAVIGLADRVNYCFTRSLAGNKLPVESREMQDILAYLAWLSTGVPVGEGKRLAGAEGLRAMPADLTGDRERGRSIFAGKCAVCHGPNGAGNPAIQPGVPALWGGKSFSVGASMARQGKATSFIWHNMPYGAGKTLMHQEAADVAAYVTAQARPDSPGKEHDWPMGGAPADVPYATKGHSAHDAPPVLHRGQPQRAIVAPPAPVRRGGVSGGTT
jgi:thiosulfate dehydrogenase